jgi:hypothetical protein
MWTAELVAWLVCTPALASEPSDASPAIADGPTSEPTSDVTGVFDAETLGGVTRAQHRWLKPRRHLMAANPYQDVDYTSYTLEWGELKIGLANVHFGVAPRVQIGTMPLLDLAGVYNGSLKANFLRAGPFDMSATANIYHLPLGDFKGTLWGAGLSTSVQVAKPVSIHVGANYNQLGFSGLPSKLPPLISALSGNPDISSWAADAEAASGISIPSPEFRGDMISVRLAADVRINRRDALILQASTVAWARARGDLDLPEGNGTGPVPVFHINDVFDVQKAFTPAESYAVTLSYQFSWKQLQLRAGGGASAIPFQWALQANDISWRMWGKTRLDETRAKDTWRKGRKHVDDQPASPEPSPVDAGGVSEAEAPG